MHNEITKAEVLDTLRAERSRWENLLVTVGDARMTQQVPGGLWSPKDIMAHVAWYEQETAAVLQAGNDPHARRDWLWEIPEYQRNVILYREHCERPLGEVRATAQEAYAHLVAAVVALTEENGRDPQRFPHMPPPGPPGNSLPSTPTSIIANTPRPCGPGWIQQHQMRTRLRGAWSRPARRRRAGP
jgi:hypothetical protein